MRLVRILPRQGMLPGLGASPEKVVVDWGPRELCGARLPCEPDRARILILEYLWY